MTIGERIKKLREERGFGVNELARLVLASATMISLLERNSRTPGGDLTVRLSEVLGCTTDYILTGKS